MADTATFDRIVYALARFETMLTPVPPTDLPGFVGVRVELAKATNAFLTSERAGMDDPINGVIDTIHDAARRALFTELTALRMRYSAHIAKWDNRAIGASWRDYRAESIVLVTGMRALLARRDEAMTAFAA